MSLQINTNLQSLAAERHLDGTEERLDKTLQRMASGERIIQAADDPAGLAIADSLNAQTRSLGTAIRNAQDGISLIQVFEGGTNEINNMLVRLRELAMQSATDTVGSRERDMLNDEAVQLKQEIDRVAKTTRFAGQTLLSGENVKMEFQVGVNNDPDVDRIAFAPGDTNLTVDALDLGGLNISEKGNAQESLDKLDQALNRVDRVRARVGSVQNRLNSTVTAQEIFRENLLAAKSRIMDADMAQESASLARETILKKAGVAVLAQANQEPALALNLLRA